MHGEVVPALKPRERVRAALEGRRPDRVPKGEILVAPDFLENLRMPGPPEITGFPELLHHLGADLVTVEAGSADIPHWIKEGFFVFLSVPGPLQLFFKDRGLTESCRLLMREPVRAAGEITRFAREGLSVAEAGLAAGAEAVIVMDDLAGNHGPLISPKVLDQVYFPALAEVTAHLEAHGVPVLFHSDGNILSLLEPLRQAGFRGVQGLQPSAGMDPEEVQARCPRDWVFWGNFALEGREGLKSPAEAAADTHELLRRWRDHPGFIFGTCGGLYGGLSPDTIMAAYRAANTTP